jgi:hypothetical protein
MLRHLQIDLLSVLGRGGEGAKYLASMTIYLSICLVSMFEASNEGNWF